MSGAEMHRRRDAHLAGLFPPGCTQTPLIPRFEAGKPEFRARCDEIIAAAKAVLKERVGHGHADRVQSMIHRARIAAAVAKEASLRIVTAIDKRPTEDILCRFLAHAATTFSGLLAAAFRTPQ